MLQWNLTIGIHIVHTSFVVIDVFMWQRMGKYERLRRLGEVICYILLMKAFCERHCVSLASIIFRSVNCVARGNFDFGYTFNCNEK